MIATEEKEKEGQENDNEGEEEEKRRKEKEKDPSTMEFLKMVMKFHHKIFTFHHACWERVWGSECMMGRCGAFEHTTTLSSMHFTHCTPDTIPSHAALSGSTLQIYSIQIKELNGNLNWPLKVYGVVVARDTVDRNRNILFSRTKRNHQLLTEKDPFLHLTGPSRAILAVDPVDFEVELKINKGLEFRERVLISLHGRYYATDNTSLFLRGPECTAELSIERLATPLQATIVGARVVEGGWPFKHGCRVVCSSFAAAAEATPREVVLLDYHGKRMRVGWDGYLHLSRNVISVELQGTRRVVIQAYSESGHQAQQGHVDFPAQRCQTRKGECFIGNSKLEIVVAWSLLVKEKLDLLVDCPAVERSVVPP
uniref:Uncharacterized protein n=1 Tax=Avena sativa TaxID=4498 RepID=A0ACD5Y6M9_AVESA